MTGSASGHNPSSALRFPVDELASLAGDQFRKRIIDDCAFERGVFQSDLTQRTAVRPFHTLACDTLSHRTDRIAAGNYPDASIIAAWSASFIRLIAAAVSAPQAAVERYRRRSATPRHA
jgi:hypothetical protein